MCCSKSKCQDYSLMSGLLCFAIGVVFLFWSFAESSNSFIETPRFEVESISISLEHNTTADDDDSAKWNIGFSVGNPNPRTLYYRDFHVWIQCMSRSSSQAAIPPFEQAYKNTTSLNATVYTSVSPHARSQLVQGAVVDVILRTRFGHSDVIKFACKDVGVGFLSGATQGFMVGGPVLCHVVLE